MPFIEYEPKTFSATRMAVVDQANAICEEYERQGIDLTLRQLYYQFVARGFIPNAQREYDRLGKICTEARMAGVMDWNHLTDLTRELRDLPHWESPSAIMRAVGSQYRTDRWEDQPTRVEVWIEKDAAVGGDPGRVQRAGRALLLLSRLHLHERDVGGQSTDLRPSQQPERGDSAHRRPRPVGPGHDPRHPGAAGAVHRDRPAQPLRERKPGLLRDPPYRAQLRPRQ
jgi:hypothetical protein